MSVRKIKQVIPNIKNECIICINCFDNEGENITNIDYDVHEINYLGLVEEIYDDDSREDDCLIPIISEVPYIQNLYDSIIYKDVYIYHTIIEKRKKEITKEYVDTLVKDELLKILKKDNKK